MSERLRLLLIKRSFPERYRLLKFLEAAQTGKAPKDFEGAALVFIGQLGREVDDYINYVQESSQEGRINTFYLYARGSEDLKRAKVISSTLCAEGDFVQTDTMVTPPRGILQDFVPEGIICLRKK